MQVRHEDFLHAERLDADAREDDVCDGIERAHLMKVDILHAHAVDFSLGLGDAAEDPERVSFHEWREVAGLDERADFAVRAAMLMPVFVLMRVPVFMSVFVCVTVLMAVPVPAAFVAVIVVVIVRMFAMRMPVRVGVVFRGVLVLVRVLQRRVSLGGCMGVLVLRIVVVLVMMMHVPLFAVLV